MKLIAAAGCLLYCVSGIAQTVAKAPLHFSGSVSKLTVLPSGQMVIGSRTGEMAFTDSITGYWQLHSPVAKDSDGLSLGATMENINFFNSDTGFISGFIMGRDNKYNIIYHTANRGKTWTTINFGQEGWVDDAVNLNNGEAWMSVSGGGIAYTRDYGFTWQALAIPDKKQRFTAMYFNVQQQGIIGSLSNMIAITSNNCRSWTMLPTPLDQKKYTKTYKEARADINAVALYKNYYLACQEGLVFYTLKDSINWIWLPNYSNFYTDAANSALYFKLDKGGYEKVNEQLLPQHRYDSSHINYGAATCSNGRLFITDATMVSQLQPGGGSSFNYISTNTPEKPVPQIIAYAANGTYGHIGNAVYVQQHYNGKWNFEFELPFATDSGSLSMPDKNTLLLTMPDGNLLYYDMAAKKITRKKSDEVIAAFCESNITRIAFENGSRGCFHNYADRLVYAIEGDVFELEDNPLYKGKKGKGMPANDDEIPAGTVTDFIRALPAMLAKPTVISELGFTATDYAQCKLDIEQFKAFAEGKSKYNKTGFEWYKNNIDFNRLSSLVDSIKDINASQLDQSLAHLSDMWSTTTNWKSIILENDAGQTLLIQCFYYEPNAFYFPWQVSIDGIKMSTTSMHINRFVNTVYPLFIDGKNKVAVLHKIVKQLY